MNQPLVSCHQASRTFGSGHRSVVAVHNLSCRVAPGDRVAVVGPSGSGKSTLIHLLAGLDDPTTGVVSWPGLGNSPHQDPSQVGVIFQGLSLIPALTAQENAAIPLLLRGASHPDAQRAALLAMRSLGIEAMANQLPEELSGGQAQRVAAARVLAARPRLILADEPTGQLDQVAGRRVVDVLLETADELDAGLVVATHDAHVAARFASQWRMHDGALRAVSPPATGGAALERDSGEPA
jgi:putative ABC transport system ATP-binding protein